MAVIKHIKGTNKTEYAYLNIFPDQFKSESEKQDDTYVKETMDYFANKAYNGYIQNRDTFVKNYDLMKGILRIEDFYQEPGVKTFTDMLTPKEDLPLHVKQYSIMTTPVNELVGEITKRPDTYRVKAFDDDSKAEELQWKTEMLQEHIIGTARQKIIEKAAIEGQEIKPEDLEQLTMNQVQDQLDTYTSVAEKWANHQLTASKMEFNVKQMSEDAFRDLLISSREFYHIYEDNSKSGFNVEVSNPKNTWYLSTPDYKYTSDPSGRNQGAYAAGTVKIMELSEIIESCPELNEEEIKHLRTSLQDYGLINVRESNLGNPNVEPGIDSITYDTYDPLVLQERQMVEAEMQENGNSLENFFGQPENVSAFGYKYSVVVAYWVSKKKIARVEFEDELGNIQSMLVDENYVSGAIPTQTNIEWGWINQWYQGKKIGPDIYHVKPFDLLTYCPIIGTLHEIKNTQPQSLVDLMKPFQVIYNVAMNQLYELLEKEIGQVQLMSLRHIPIPKDGDAQDALDIWEAEARDRGVVFIDDSPENLKAPSSFNQFTSLDLTRTKEIQTRYTLAQQMKLECWELVGMTKQRMGQVTAGETATGTNTAMQQSYSQTEPLFVAHEYVQGMLYQAIIDASLYVESANETSTLSYVTSEGESSFVKVNGTDLRFRDLKCYPTNRPEDTRMFNEIRALSQAILQNGGSLYDVIELYTTKSQRDMKKTFKDLKDKQDAQIQTQNEQAQQGLDQSQEQFVTAEENLKEEKRVDRENDNYQNELERINKKEVAAIKALAFNENATEDLDNSGIADSLEVTNQMNAKTKSTQDYTSKMAAIRQKASAERAKLAVKREEIQVSKDNQKNDLDIAKQNAKGRGSGSK
jgi:hypothetical protein